MGTALALLLPLGIQSKLRLAPKENALIVPPEGRSTLWRATRLESREAVAVKSSGYNVIEACVKDLAIVEAVKECMSKAYAKKLEHEAKL